MIIKPLVIGNLKAPLPIIQGGMGVGISRYRLASAVANEGGIGVISAAQIGFDEEDFYTNTLEANLRALRKHITKAKEIAPSGIIGLNIMVATNYYEEQVKTAIDAGVDIIISGAGLPTALPGIVGDANVKIAPIVSSSRAAAILLKSWDRKFNVTADAVVVEGPKAGGHLGFSLEELNEGKIDIDKILLQVIEVVKEYEIKYNKTIPVIMAGGVYDGYDIAKYLKLGASGVQIATRLIATNECDAHENYKQAFVDCTKEDIELVKSPVGMPGRAIRNKLVELLKESKIKVKKCCNCLKRELCDRVTIPYCITEKLIQAVNGDVDNGLLFCGENAYRINKIVSVKDIFDEIKSELIKL